MTSGPRHSITLLIVLCLSCAALAEPGDKQVASAISDFGIPVLALSVTARALGDSGSRDKVLPAGIQSLLTTGGTTLLLKAVVREKRPDGHGHDSFPSGHTSMAFAMAGVLAQQRGFGGAAWYVPAAAIGWSRVRLRRHRFVDVLAGAAIGYGFSELAVHDHQPRRGNGPAVMLLQRRW